MARQTPKGAEFVTVVAQHSGPKDIDFGHAEPGEDGLVQPVLPPTYAHGSAPVAADATARNPKRTAEELASVPEKRWFRVINDKPITVLITQGATSYRATLKPGKELDNLNFNVRDLQKQGVKLVRIDPSMGKEDIFVE